MISGKRFTAGAAWRDPSYVILASNIQLNGNRIGLYGNRIIIPAKSAKGYRYGITSLDDGDGQKIYLEDYPDVDIDVIGSALFLSPDNYFKGSITGTYLRGGVSVASPRF